MSTIREFADDTIVALATPSGVGAIGIIRLSGKDAIRICNQVFKGKDLEKQSSHTIHFGTIQDNGTTLDEVLVSLFIAPRSYTRENVVEISCHGSPFIIRQIIQLLVQNGARLARAGEFTKRAFMNGRFDLTQAEAVADLISSDSEASHRAALQQMRGGFSELIRNLRNQLIHFASMIELELDFVEEDVEFASREDLKNLVQKLQDVIQPLIDSFQLGNVIKQGIPTVIAGKPNAGKSTLLNALLNEEKAIVSDIPGTTRDFIEDTINLEGYSFRFIDTAGIREATDKIEAIGVSRTREQMRKASLIIYLFDLEHDTLTEIQREINLLENTGVPFLKVANKVDAAQPALMEKLQIQEDIVFISARNRENLDLLKSRIVERVNLPNFRTGETLVTNIRHYQSLVETRKSLQEVVQGIDAGITNDFLAQDIKNALYHLGEITGDISTEDLLANIFSKFCIGK